MIIIFYKNKIEETRISFIEDTIYHAYLNMYPFPFIPFWVPASSFTTS